MGALPWEEIHAALLDKLAQWDVECYQPGDPGRMAPSAGGPAPFHLSAML